VNIERPEVTVRGLVLTSRDSGMAGKRLDVITRENGRMIVFAPQSRRSRPRIGTLLPGSRMYLTLRREETGWQVHQAEGTVLVDVMTWTYEDWLAYYAFPLWLAELFPTEEREEALYELTERYLILLASKHLVISTLIACWQTAVLAGYAPMVLAQNGKLPLDADAKAALRLILAYTWNPSERITLKNGIWMRLAQTLLYFARYHVSVEVPSLAELVKEKY